MRMQPLRRQRLLRPKTTTYLLRMLLLTAAAALRGASLRISFRPTALLLYLLARVLWACLQPCRWDEEHNAID
jgi:hypothetical protein